MHWISPSLSSACTRLFDPVHLPLEIRLALGPLELVLALLPEELGHDLDMLLALVMVADALSRRQGGGQMRREKQE